MWQHWHAGLGLFFQHVAKRARCRLVGYQCLQPEQVTRRSVSAYYTRRESAQLRAEARRQLLPFARRRNFAGKRAELDAEAVVGSPRARDRGGGWCGSRGLYRRAG